MEALVQRKRMSQKNAHSLLGSWCSNQWKRKGKKARLIKTLKDRILIINIESVRLEENCFKLKKDPWEI